MLLIGVSIAVPPPYGPQLLDARAGYGDPQASTVPTHVTLLPPTEVPMVTVEVVSKHLARVAEAHPPFRMALSGTGTFRPVSPVVFVNVVDGFDDCVRLEQDVRSGPLARAVEFDYHPHVTVAHHLPDDILDRAARDLSGFTCQFDVTEFHLWVPSDLGVWEPRDTFVLTGPDT